MNNRLRTKCDPKYPHQRWLFIIGTIWMLVTATIILVLFLGWHERKIEGIVVTAYFAGADAANATLTPPIADYDSYCAAKNARGKFNERSRHERTNRLE